MLHTNSHLASSNTPCCLLDSALEASSVFRRLYPASATAPDNLAAAVGSVAIVVAAKLQVVLAAAAVPIPPAAAARVGSSRAAGAVAGPILGDSAAGEGTIPASLAYLPLYCLSLFRQPCLSVGFAGPVYTTAALVAAVAGPKPRTGFAAANLGRLCRLLCLFVRLLGRRRAAGEGGKLLGGHR